MTDPSTRPTVLSVIPERIPRELRSVPRWVVWRGVWRDGRWTKPPYDPRSGGRASVSDPDTWGSFEDAVRVYQAAYPAVSESEGWDGIGVMIGPPWVGVDLDHGFDPAQRRWDSDEHRRIVEELRSYSEYSPSGTGVHVLVSGVLPPGGRRRNGLEMYETARYLTVTGRLVPGAATTVESRTAELAAIHRRVFGAAPMPTGGGQADQRDGTQDDETAEVDRQLWAALFGDPRRGRATRALFEGDTSHYASPSDADHGLLVDLARADPDPERIARRFRQSRLYLDPERRAKHDAQHHADGRSYLAGSVEAALAAVAKATAPEALITVGSDPAGWPAPDPIFRERPAPVLQLDLLPAEIRDYAADVAERRQAPADFVVWPLLASQLAMLGRGIGCRPRVYDDWIEPAALWVANVGGVSTLKSVAGADGTWPLRREEAEQRARFDAEHEVWRQTCEALRQANPRIARRDLPDEPVMRARLTTDATVEKIGVLLAGHDRGLLLYRDELAGFVADLNRYHREGGDRQFYLQAYTGGEYTVNRITRPDIHVQQLLVGLVGGLQPERARELLGSGPNDGFGARFTTIWPDVPQSYAPPRGGPNRAAQAALRFVCGRLAQEEWRTELLQDPFGEVPACAPDPDGQQVFDAWHTHFVTQWRGLGRDDYFVGRLGKYPGLAVRLMLAFQMHEWAAGRAPRGARHVGADVVERVLRLVMGYVLPMDRRVYDAFAATPAALGGRRIARWILEARPTSFSAREVRRHEWSDLDTVASVADALEWLCAHRWLREAVPEARAGRPSSVFLVNPRTGGAGA